MTIADILLVEDESIAQEIIARGLQRLGYRVTGVGDRADAIPLLHRRGDVVVTDLVLNRPNGLSSR